MARQLLLGKIEHKSTIRMIPISEMRVSPMAQRKQRQYRVDNLAANLDLSKLGTPVVNFRGGHWWIIDGAHRVEALRINDFGDQAIECRAYEGLTLEEEAEMFLGLNDFLNVNAMDKFQVGIVAGRDDNITIDEIVRELGLNVSAGGAHGSIGSVLTLKRVYKKAGADGLRKTLTIVRDAYGDSGYRAQVIDGIGLFVIRYDEQIDVPRLIDRLRAQHDGVQGLVDLASRLRRSTGYAVPECIAATTVEIYNRGRNVTKLDPWWRADR